MHGSSPINDDVGHTSILVIDDELEILRLVSHVLRSHDYLVDCAATGALGLELALTGDYALYHP